MAYCIYNIMRQSIHIDDFTAKDLFNMIEGLQGCDTYLGYMKKIDWIPPEVRKHFEGKLEYPYDKDIKEYKQKTGKVYKLGSSKKDYEIFDMYGDMIDWYYINELLDNENMEVELDFALKYIDKFNPWSLACCPFSKEWGEALKEHLCWGTITARYKLLSDNKLLSDDILLHFWKYIPFRGPRLHRHLNEYFYTRRVMKKNKIKLMKKQKKYKRKTNF